jgi:Fe-S-cluster containining protein
MSDDKPKIPFESAVMPEALSPETEITFRCHKGISCFNACCRQADVTLAPYDIIRLKKRLGMTSSEFLKQYTVPFQMDRDGAPGVKLKTDETGTCLHSNGEAGCGVYEDRPTVCRHYPVALLSMRATGSPTADQSYSLVKEAHCRGHDEDRVISIADYREEQGCAGYDELNREWYELILKKQSAGPAVGRPPQTSLNLFFMASYDIDNFRRFVLSDQFRNTYVLSDELLAEIEADDLALLCFGYRLLRQVLFAEHSIQERAGVWDKRVRDRREVWEARRQVEIARRQKEEDEKYERDV